MAVGIAYQIIRENVNDQITFNIIALKNPKEMLNKFKRVYTKVGQEVVYLILQELFYYPRINKPKEYKKLVMQIFS